MKKFIFLFLFIFALFSNAHAREFKIATIDMKRVMRDYKDLQDAQKELSQYEREWTKVKDSLFTQLQKEKRDFEKKIPMLTPEGILEEQKKISGLEKEYADYIKKIWGDGGEYEKKLKETTRPYLEKLHGTINKIATEEEYDFIFDRSSKLLLYSGNVNDITDEVLEYLNKEYVSQSPTETKKRICVFSLTEKDKDVKNLGLGKKAQDVAVVALKNSPNFEVLSSSAVNSKMSNMGIRPENLSESQAVQIATSLGVDYFVMGEVSKKAQGYYFKLILYDTRTMQAINTKEGTAQNSEELFSQEIANKSKELINPIVPKKQ